MVRFSGFGGMAVVVDGYRWLIAPYGRALRASAGFGWLIYPDFWLSSVLLLTSFTRDGFYTPSALAGFIGFLELEKWKKVCHQRPYNTKVLDDRFFFVFEE